MTFLAGWRLDSVCTDTDKKQPHPVSASASTQLYTVEGWALKARHVLADTVSSAASCVDWRHLGKPKRIIDTAIRPLLNVHNLHVLEYLMQQQ